MALPMRPIELRMVLSRFLLRAGSLLQEQEVLRRRTAEEAVRRMQEEEQLRMRC